MIPQLIMPGLESSLAFVHSEPCERCKTPRKILMDARRPKAAVMSPPATAGEEAHEESSSSSTSPVGDRRHTYRVGPLKIPVRNPGLIGSPRSRFVRKYKDILHRMERSDDRPERDRVDLDSIEPPIRKRTAPRDQASFLPSSRQSPPMGFRSEPDKDIEDDE